MARASKYSTDDLLDAAAWAVRDYGRDATIAQVGEQIGAPVGSIYHRFSSRDDLLAQLWIRSIRRFHVGLLAAYALDDPKQALLEAARHIPRYCRQNPVEAQAMTLFRQPLLVESCSTALRDDVAHINDEVHARVEALTAAHYGKATPRLMLIVLTATQQLPYGLVKVYLGSAVPMPPWLEDACVGGAEAVLKLGEKG